MALHENIVASIYGHLCGDALGVPYEFNPARSMPERIAWGVSGTHAQPPGTWSDDGALMLCHVASLLECGGFDARDTGQRFVRWLDEGYMAAGGVVFDVGRTTSNALDRLRAGADALDAGPAGELDNGNGSLMRILPIALWSCGGPFERQIELCHAASRITHGHARSQACCAVYGLLIRHLLAGGGFGEAWEVALDTVEDAYSGWATWGPRFVHEIHAIRRFDRPGGSGYVIDTLVSACRAVGDSSGYVDAVERAVRYGHDTDTTAAVTGGLAALVYGLAEVPSAWRGELRLTAGERALIERFAACVAG